MKRKTILSERKRKLIRFCKPLGLRFRNLELLDLAFRHRSYANESSEKRPENNERLEFLGDSVLGLAAATYLYKTFENNPEGDLAKIKSVVVSEKTLAPIALRFGIDKMLVLGRGEELSGGRQKPAILADCMESIIGAYFLDAGYAAAETYVLSFLVPEIEKVQEDRGSKDYKTLLQELYQKKTKECPRYETVSVTGPDHDRTFSVTVYLGESAYGPESGKSKKEAEQKAAKKAYTILTGKGCPKTSVFGQLP
ncbi:ribonuclease III [Treponema socranskii subsp. paredis ATCC 35535]|nr:ribonuclease III [Treponema socranskii subsp. paredis ATCC 35535]